jgi:hypothetical protein
MTNWPPPQYKSIFFTHIAVDLVERPPTLLLKILSRSAEVVGIVRVSKIRIPRGGAAEAGKDHRPYPQSFFGLGIR